MDNVSLSIKEEIADETKYGSSSLHPDIGVLEENSSQVMRCEVDQFSDSSFYCKFCHFHSLFADSGGLLPGVHKGRSRGGKTLCSWQFSIN